MAYALHTSIIIPADRLAAWAGFALTPHETSQLADALAESTLPDVIGTIAAEFRSADNDPEV